MDGAHVELERLTRARPQRERPVLAGAHVAHVPLVDEQVHLVAGGRRDLEQRVAAGHRRPGAIERVRVDDDARDRRPQLAALQTPLGELAQRALAGQAGTGDGDRLAVVTRHRLAELGLGRRDLAVVARRLELELAPIEPREQLPPLDALPGRDAHLLDVARDRRRHQAPLERHQLGLGDHAALHRHEAEGGERERAARRGQPRPGAIGAEPPREPPPGRVRQTCRRAPFGLAPQRDQRRGEERDPLQQLDRRRGERVAVAALEQQDTDETGVVVHRHAEQHGVLAASRERPMGDQRAEPRVVRGVAQRRVASARLRHRVEQQPRLGRARVHPRLVGDRPERERAVRIRQPDRHAGGSEPPLEQPGQGVEGAFEVGLVEHPGDQLEHRGLAPGEQLRPRRPHRGRRRASRERIAGGRDPVQDGRRSASRCVGGSKVLWSGGGGHRIDGDGGRESGGAEAGRTRRLRTLAAGPGRSCGRRDTLDYRP